MLLILYFKLLYSIIKKKCIDTYFITDWRVDDQADSPLKHDKYKFNIVTIIIIISS